MIGRATIRLGNGPHSSYSCFTDHSVIEVLQSVCLCMCVSVFVITEKTFDLDIDHVYVKFVGQGHQSKIEGHRRKIMSFFG